MHAIVHFRQTEWGRQWEILRVPEPLSRDLPAMEFVTRAIARDFMLFVFAFAAAFRRAAPSNCNAVLACVGAAVCAVLLQLLPQPFHVAFFTMSVQAAVALAELSLPAPRQGRWWALYGLCGLTTLPLKWLEATACTGFLEVLGGHAAYDAMTGAYPLLYYAAASYVVRRGSTVAQKRKD